MHAIYEKPKSFIDTPTHFLSGLRSWNCAENDCEIIDAWGIRGKTIGLAPVGCAVLAYNYLDIDMCEAAHGRPPAVATGIKRVHPDHVVFAYQGDGDLAAIGTAEIIHAANRGENITFIFVNNAVYGMTSGQMAPTTLLKQKTVTTPSGRDPINSGYPIRVCELLAVLDGSSYLERVSLSSPENIRKTKRPLKKGLKPK